MKNWKNYLLLLLCSCGYQWTDGPRPTVSVPFIIGDEHGLLTKEIVAALSGSGLVDVSSSGGYTVSVRILGESTTPIGFRVDPQKVFGEVRQNLLATEARRSITIEMSLCHGGKVTAGPFTLTAEVDYDYVDGDSIPDLTFVDAAGVTRTVLPFSLGQLEPAESAALAATRPLYRRLAQKVVDAITSSYGICCEDRPSPCDDCVDREPVEFDGL